MGVCGAEARTARGPGWRGREVADSAARREVADSAARCEVADSAARREVADSAAGVARWQTAPHFASVRVRVPP